ncbi:Mu transposase domain-containing protein, partial [Corynebacterium striatum]|uniref:Mu transposase domain-containing protein n=1 Tax=Corynebacterium striatum TaxID=43770 RepID=UPI003F7F2C80
MRDLPDTPFTEVSWRAVKVDRNWHICCDYQYYSVPFQYGPDPRKVDTSGVSYAAWVSVADVSASKSLGARRLHQECRLRV